MTVSGSAFRARATESAGVAPQRTRDSVRSCPSARRAISFYRGRYFTHRKQMGAGDSGVVHGGAKSPLARTACPLTRWLVGVWRDRAYIARRTLEIRLALRRRMADPDYAIEVVFGSRAEEAKAVAACESGDTDGDLSPHVVRARNGQYLGLFQMGDWERRTFGHGYTPLAQVKAAYAYFVASGRDWSPWACRTAIRGG